MRDGPGSVRLRRAVTRFRGRKVAPGAAGTTRVAAGDARLAALTVVRAASRPGARHAKPWAGARPRPGANGPGDARASQRDAPRRPTNPTLGVFLGVTARVARAAPVSPVKARHGPGSFC